MNTVAHALRSAVEILLWPFDLLPTWLGLTLMSILSGAAMLWVVGKTTPQARLERARDRLAGGVYEVRLFLDSPVRIVAALLAMLKWSAVYIGLMLPALVVMTVPLGLLYLHLDARHGIAPAPLHEPLVVQIELADGVDGGALRADESDDLLVTAPLVYDAAGQRVYLRLEVQRPGSHTLTLHLGGVEIDKRIDASPNARIVSPTRSSGVDMMYDLTAEPPLSRDEGVTRIDVPHPDIDGRWLGIAMPWWVYWLGIATVAALALRKPMGVVL